MLSTRKQVSHSSLLEEAKSIANKIVVKVDPLKVICFGSVASGLTTDQSDIDLLVVLEDHMNIMEARRRFLPARKGYKTALDLVWISSKDFERKKHEGGISMIAHEEGLIIYEKKNSEQANG